MANTIFDEQDGAARSTSDAPPTHYMVKIDLFSLLAKNSIERYETGEFEAGGHKWKLILHPNGNKSKNVKDHVSLYLALAEAGSFRSGWEVSAVFRLFLLDQNKDNYLTIQDATGTGKRFHGMKPEWGFDQFISLKAFNEIRNGYLVNDTCVFGAEVFICKERVTGKGEQLSMMKEGISYKHTWKIENFTNMEGDCSDSATFSVGDQKWKLQIYPKGTGRGASSHVSLFLALDNDSLTLLPGTKIFAEYKLNIIDQVSAKTLSAKATHWFSPSSKLGGWERYIPLSYFNQTNSGCVVKGTCYVEAEVTILGQVTPL